MKPKISKRSKYYNAAYLYGEARKAVLKAYGAIYGVKRGDLFVLLPRVSKKGIVAQKKGIVA